MDLKVKSQKDNAFLERKELVLEAKGEKVTPSYAQLKAEVAKNLKASEDQVVLKKVNQQFGKQDVLVEAYLYNSAEAAKKYEKVKVKKGAATPAQ